jgi:urease accessory protein
MDENVPITGKSLQRVFGHTVKRIGLTFLLFVEIFATRTSAPVWRQRARPGATIHAVAAAEGVASVEPIAASVTPAVRRGVVAVAPGPRGSAVTRAYAESPLKWLTPGNSGRAAWIFAASYGGGLVGGDHLALDVDVAAGAAALLSTQASTKVFRSAAGTSTRLDARLGADALLVSLPDPVVPFAGSDYRQTQAFDLDHSSGLVALDWMASGRRGSGERWAFDGYASTTTVRVGGRLAVHDAVRLERTDGDLAARAGRFDVLATVVLAGAPMAAAAAQLLTTVAAMPVERRAAVVISAGPLPGLAAAPPGCVVRVAGVHVEDVRRLLRSLLDFVPALLGDDPWARKW